MPRQAPPDAQALGLARPRRQQQPIEAVRDGLPRLGERRGTLPAPALAHLDGIAVQVDEPPDESPNRLPPRAA
jgi:hypothetical protein